MSKEVVVDENQKPAQNDLSNVSVVLDENGQAVKKEKQAPEPKYVTADMLSQTLEQAIKKATAPLYYELRNKDKQPYQPPVQPQPKPEPTEWDQKLMKDWKGTVEELAEEKVKAILEAEKAQQRAEYERQQTLSLLEQNKKRVLEKHPELNDETSDKTNIYRQVLQERPEYLNNSFGPVLAMRDMEDRLRDSGVIDDKTRQVVQKEVNRQVRAGSGAVPNGVAASKNRVVTLSKEQKEFCDLKGIKYENYAKYVKQLEGKGGVEA